MRVCALVALACAAMLLASPPQRKKKKEEETQTLQVPKDLPNAVIGDTRRLVYYVTPLSAKGLLSQQIRDALKALSRQAGSDTILMIRAFVAGSGDSRRVRDLVSEYYTDRHQPLPSLSLVQAGGLPMEGAQVILEATASRRKEVSEHGLVFISAQTATSENPLDPVPPLAEKSLEQFRQTLKAAGAEPAAVMRVTCFVSSLENLAAVRKMVEAEYPKAAQNFVQPTRAPERALAACEGVAQLGHPIGKPVELLDPEGLPREPGQSRMALVESPRVVLTGSQVSFGYQEQDARLAFERLDKSLQQSGVSIRDVAFVHYYPLSASIAGQVRKVGPEFFDKARPPAGTMLLFESLPSMDAGFALDLVAAKGQ
jgi:enamine deaminase RidA (YjgF/YER057c/UK114 family)